MSTETVETFPTEHKFDDQELFDHAEAVEAPDTPEAPATEVEQPVTAEVAASETPAERPAVDDNAPLVPSWRLREINEEKRTLADRIAALEAEKATWQRPQAQQPQPQPAVAEKVVKPDPLIDPDGYESYLERKFEERQIARDRENSLQQAAKTYKDEFQEAYTAAQQKVDPALRALMQQSRDPGETLIQWHREQKNRQEIGGDLNAYKQRLRDEALKDPEFRKQAIAAWQDEAQPVTNGRPNVALPPSLNGASRSNASLSNTVGNDLSDEGLWEHANA